MWARIAVSLMILGIVGGGAPTETWAQSATQTAPVKEYQLKSVFLFHFTQFVDWPPTAFADADSPLVIGILGDDPFGPYLDDAIRGERVNGRPIVVQRYRKLADVKTCQVVFISQSESDRLGQIVNGLRGHAILTVSDIDDFAKHGGMIQFITSKNKIHLGINVDAAKAANVTISSKLLRSADIIKGERE